MKRENTTEGKFEFFENYAAVGDRYTPTGFQQGIGAQCHIAVVAADDHQSIFIEIGGQTHGAEFCAEALEKTECNFGRALMPVEHGDFQDIIVKIGANDTGSRIEVDNPFCRDGLIDKFHYADFRRRSGRGNFESVG